MFHRSFISKNIPSQFRTEACYFYRSRNRYLPSANVVDNVGACEINRYRCKLTKIRQSEAISKTAKKFL